MTKSKEEKVYCIYMHTSPSGKSYIGQTSNYKKRCNTHKRLQNRKCTAFSRAIEKHGWDAFTHDVLLDGLTAQEADYWEEFCIEEFNTLAPNGYNLNTGGSAFRMSDEARVRMSDAAKKRCQSMTSERMAEINKKRAITVSNRTAEEWELIAEKAKETRASWSDEYRRQILEKQLRSRFNKTNEEIKALYQRIKDTRRMNIFGTTDEDVISEKIKLRKRNYSKQYRVDNIDKCKEYDKLRWQSFSDEEKAKFNEKARNYRKNNPEKIKEYEKRRVRPEPTEEEKLKQKEYSRNYYLANKSKILARQKEKRLQNNSLTEEI